MKMQNLVPWQDVSANISDPSNSVSTAGSLFQTAMGEFNNMIDRKRTSETDKINNEIMAAEDPDKIREMLQGAKENNWADLNSINQTGIGRLDTLFSQNMETDKFDFTKDSEFWNRGFKEKELGQKMAIARMQEESANARAMYKADQSLKSAMAKSDKSKAYLFGGGNTKEALEDFNRAIGPIDATALNMGISNALGQIENMPELYNIYHETRENPNTGKIYVDPDSLNQGINLASAALATNMITNNPNSRFAQYATTDDKGNFTGFIQSNDPMERQIIAGYALSIREAAAQAVQQHQNEAIEVSTTVRQYPRKISGLLGNENNTTFNKFAEKLPSIINAGRSAKNPVSDVEKVKILRDAEERYRSSGDAAASIASAVMAASDIPPEDFKRTYQAYMTLIKDQIELVMKHEGNHEKFVDKSSANFQRNEEKVKTARSAEEKLMMIRDSDNLLATFNPGNYLPSAESIERGKAIRGRNAQAEQEYNQAQYDLKKWKTATYGGSY